MAEQSPVQVDGDFASSRSPRHSATVRLRVGAGGADDTIIDVDDIRLFGEN